jgi:hypothetical protein
MGTDLANAYIGIFVDEVHPCDDTTRLLYMLRDGTPVHHEAPAIVPIILLL